MTSRVLILGSNGRFGRQTAEAFWNAGWQVRCFDRKGRLSLNRAAKDVDVIVHGWNPVYEDWEKDVPAQTEQVIKAARQNNATVIIPGNVYVFGQESAARFAPDTPHAAKNPLGQIRMRMERRFREAGVRTVVLRAGDFLDTSASGNWFDLLMVARLEKGIFTYPGDRCVDRAWAFLPDMARATVALAEMREELADFEDIPFPGYTMSGQRLFEAVQKTTNQPLKLKDMNWLPVYALSPFRKRWRHIIEMRYLWSKPHFLDGDRFEQLLPDFVSTPLEEAVALAIAHKDMAGSPKRGVASGVQQTA